MKKFTNGLAKLFAAYLTKTKTPFTLTVDLGDKTYCNYAGHNKERLLRGMASIYSSIQNDNLE